MDSPGREPATRPAPNAADSSARIAGPAVSAARTTSGSVEAAGLAIVGVSDIVEGGVAAPPAPRYSAARMMVAEDASTPVEAGSLEIAVSVTVTYRTS